MMTMSSRDFVKFAGGRLVYGKNVNGVEFVFRFLPEEMISHRDGIIYNAMMFAMNVPFIEDRDIYDLYSRWSVHNGYAFINVERFVDYRILEDRDLPLFVSWSKKWPLYYKVLRGLK